MPLNILLADDSVPAQNMGKKILVDAGYTVLTVSNGLEALRKIADNQPDIAILDIFMPGYTGLEICEKLRANAATANLPVVLTVGKLEPYRPEDGEHVHSNAVIVKPFAANELISAVRSLIGEPHAELPEATQEVAEPAFEAPMEPEEAPGQPLYTYGGLPSGASAPSASAFEASAYGAGPLLSDEQPESLVFNPDAEATPFSASVEGLESSGAASSGKFASAFSDFDLSADEPGFANAPFEGSVVPVEMPDFEALGRVESIARVPESFVPVPEEVDVNGEHPFEMSGSPRELSSDSEFSILDPLLETHDNSQPRESSPCVLDSCDLKVDEPPEKIFDDFISEGSVQPEPEEELSEEQLARRQAFEELFNSDEPLPIENLPVEGAPQPALDSLLDPAPSAAITPEAVASPSQQEEQVWTYAPSEPMLEAQSSFVPSALDSVEPPAEDTLGELVTREAGSVLSAEPIETIPTGESFADQPELAASQAEAAVDQADDAPTAFVPDPSLTVIEVEPMELPEEVSEPLDAFAPAFSEPQPEPFEVVDPDSYSAINEVAPTEQDLTLVDSAELPKPEESEPVATAVEPAPTLAELESLKLTQTQPESYEAEIFPVAAAAPEPSEVEAAPVAEVVPEINETERIHQAVERVFDRFKPLLISAIVRELVRHDP